MSKAEEFSKDNNFADLKKKVPAYKSHFTRAKSRLKVAFTRDDVDQVEYLHGIANEKLNTLFAVADALDILVLDLDVDNLQKEQDYVASFNDEILQLESELKQGVD